MRSLYFFFLLSIFVACGNNHNGSSTSSELDLQSTTPEISSPSTSTKDPLKSVELISPDNDVIRTSIASTTTEQTQGLQGVRDSQFANDEGKLFFYLTESNRTFWMPNTYFNLDLIYLDKNLKIIDIVWNLSHYTGSINSQIPRAPTIKSRHVLEMKAGSIISSGLKVGDLLQWKSPLSLEMTEQKIREQM